MDLNDHHVVSLTLGPVEHSPAQTGCPEYWVRRLSWINADGHESVLHLFAESGPTNLTLTGEKPAEARLDAYAQQARMVDPQDFSSQAAYDAACLPETEGTVDLAAEANPPMELPF